MGAGPACVPAPRDGRSAWQRLKLERYRHRSVSHAWDLRFQPLLYYKQSVNDRDIRGKIVRTYAVRNKDLRFTDVARLVLEG